MNTEERLEKLERELFAVQAQEASGGPKAIRANQFILEDETGKTRGALGVAKDGPTLALLDENGKHRVRLDVTRDGLGGAVHTRRD